MRTLQMGEAVKMSDDANDPSGWHRNIIDQLYDAEEVVDVAPVGPKDKLDNPDYISVKLTHGNDSDVLNDILGYENYAILSAAVGDSGELMLDITDPKLLDRFFRGLP
jgi:hypothetical protein